MPMSLSFNNNHEPGTTTLHVMSPETIARRSYERGRDIRNPHSVFHSRAERGMFGFSNRFLSPMAVSCPLPPSCGKFFSSSGIAANIANIMMWFMRDRVKATDGTDKSSKSESMISKDTCIRKAPYIITIKYTHVFIWVDFLVCRGLPGLFIASVALKVTEREDLILREVNRTNNMSCHIASLCKEIAL